MSSPYAPNAKRAKGATGSFGTPSGSKTTGTTFASIKPAPGITSSTYGAAQPTTGGGFGQSRHITVTNQTPAFPNFIPPAGSNAYTGQSFVPPAPPGVLAPTTVAPAPVPVGLFSAQPPVPAQVAAVPAVAQQLPPIGGAAAQVIQQVAAVPSPVPVKPRQRQLGGQPDFSPAFELVKEPFSWWRSVGRIFSVGSSLALVSGLVLGTKTIAEYLFPASAVIQVLLRISGSIVGYRLLSWIGNWSNTTSAAVTKIARAANEQAADGRISAKSLKELQDLLDIYDTSILKLENLLMELPKLNKDDVVITGSQYSQLLSLVTEIEMVLNTSDQITGTNHGGDKSARLRELRDRYKDALLNTLQANPQKQKEVDKAFAKLNAIPNAINANIPRSTNTLAPQPIKPFQLPKPINQQVLPLPAPQPARVTFQPRQLPPAPPMPKPFMLPPVIPQPERPTSSKEDRPRVPAKRKSQPKLKTSPRRAKPKGYTPRARKGVSDGVKKRPYSPSASTKKAVKKRSPSPRGAPKKRKAPSGSRAGDSPRSPGGRR